MIDFIDWQFLELVGTKILDNSQRIRITGKSLLTGVAESSPNVLADFGSIL
jgi:hypothetical protein